MAILAEQRNFNYRRPSLPFRDGTEPSLRGFTDAVRQDCRASRPNPGSAGIAPRKDIFGLMELQN
jgi:hypothetical protein